jgi:hypothetical protein
VYAVEISDGDDGFLGGFEQAVYAVEDFHWGLLRRTGEGFGTE